MPWRGLSRPPAEPVVKPYGCDWKAANDAKEAYREAVTFGIDGAESPVSMEDAEAFMEAVIAKMDEGLAKAYNQETGVYDTYFINEAVKYEELKDGRGNNFLNVTEFKTRAIPPFLEGQVHMMRADPSVSEKLHKEVKNSGIYDGKLEMFKINANVMEETKEIGRQNVFPRGWLENEAVFMHMEYKYFLELLRSGLYEEFFYYLKTSFVPFLDASVYGRSILENSSFIASSVHPNKSLHGTGYQSRLTGASTEMLHMWRMMTVGEKPFVLNDAKELCMRFSPKLPAWLFTEEEKEVSVYTGDGKITFTQPKNSFAFNLLGGTLTIYHNENRLDTYGKDAEIARIELYKDGTCVAEIEGGTVSALYAAQIREGMFDRIEVQITGGEAE